MTDVWSEGQLAEFDAFANTYQNLVTDSVRLSGESSEYFAAYKAAYVARVLPSKRIEKVLDYGCGVGSLAKHLKNQLPATRIDGFDLSTESLQRVDQTLRKQGVYSSCPNDLKADYDLIVLSNVLHHVRPEGRQAVFSEIFARLRDGGSLIVFEHNPYNPLTRWAVSQCPFDGDAVLLRNGETLRRFQLADFRILRSDFIVFFPRWLAPLRSLEPHLNWIPCGAQYAVVGIKGTT